MPIPVRSPYNAPETSNGVRAHTSVATLAALCALEALHPVHVDGEVVLVEADDSLWRYHSTSALTADDILVAAPTYATGRWLRAPGLVDLACPFTYATADGTAILTLPTGARLSLMRAYWEVTTGFTGGSSSAIGVASTSMATAGDILGGSGGDVAATLVPGAAIPGTIGAKMDALSELHANLFAAGEAFTLERITSAFTAGVGKVHLVGLLLRHPGA